MGLARPTVTWSSWTTPVAVALLVSLSTPGWADDKTAASCCDQSSTECNSGQSVGDKGSCPTTSTDICVQIVDKCKKKHPGVFCSCGSKDSSLGLSATSLRFTKTSRKASLTLSSDGNVPLDVNFMEFGDTSAFKIHGMRRCQGHRDLLGPDGMSVTVAPQACAEFRVR